MVLNFSMALSSFANSSLSSSKPAMRSVTLIGAAGDLNGGNGEGTSLRLRATRPPGLATSGFILNFIGALPAAEDAAAAISLLRVPTRARLGEERGCAAPRPALGSLSSALPVPRNIFAVAPLC